MNVTNDGTFTATELQSTDFIIAQELQEKVERC